MIARELPLRHVEAQVRQDLDLAKTDRQVIHFEYVIQQPRPFLANQVYWREGVTTRGRSEVHIYPPPDLPVIVDARPLIAVLVH